MKSWIALSTLVTTTFLSALSFAAASTNGAENGYKKDQRAAQRTAENTECIGNASEEIFRLMDLHEAKQMRRLGNRVQIGAQMATFDHETGTSTWFACGFEKYRIENGAVTQRYTVELDRTCKGIRGREKIRAREECPAEL